MALFSRLGIFLLLLLVAIISGLYLGKVSVKDETIATSRMERAAEPVEASDSEGERKDEDNSGVSVPPLLFYPGTVADEDWKDVKEQVIMAAESGIHQYVVTVTPAWFDDERQAQAERNSALLNAYREADPDAQFLIQINLNPTVPWFEAHSDSAMRINDAFQPYPSPASANWREAAGVALEDVITSLESGTHRKHIKGYILCALQGLRWMLPEGYDVSKANHQGYLEWLQQRYRTDDALQTAWDNDSMTLAAATIPAYSSPEEEGHVFYELPQMQPVVYFLHYSSESVADALAGLSVVVARASRLGPSGIIGAPYGYSFEALPNGCGHFALELLLESDLNMFMSPVSYVDRGLGGVGGVMGPVDSMTIRGKQWFVVDDTRTGVERDAATGEFARIKGINVEDVFEVQRRNFALALTYGLGLVWADPQAEGWLHDKDQWAHFGLLNTIYAQRTNEAKAQAPTEFAASVVTVVVDELSRAYVQSDSRINSILLQRARDAAMRSGVSLRFHLLRDVVEDIAPSTPVYLFLNAFHLTETDRVRLHSRLAREQASAIWLYAPGYITDTADVETIAATTGMDVRRFEEPFQTGSTYLLSGQFLHAEEKFGDGEIWTPAFYIEPEEEIDFLAHYVNAQDKGSVAILTLPEGWTSVYVAEPGLSPALLCELLQLLEQHRFLTPVDGVYYDVVSARDGIVALHASEAGKRSLYFGHFFDIVDLLDAAIGWPQKDSIMLPMQSGETRLLMQKPIQASAE